MSSDPNKKIWLMFNCLDWRLHPEADKYFLERHDGCDLCVTAGSLKGLLDESTKGYFLNQIEISKKLHNCQGVILTMHLDCGAYGGTGNFENIAAETAHHTNILKEAESVIAAVFPGLAIEKYIIELEQTDNGWLSRPITVS